MPAKFNPKGGRGVTHERNPTAASRSKLESLQPRVADDSYSLRIGLQNVILNAYKIAFPMIGTHQDLQERIQKVKGHLFNRDFGAAFGEPSYLEAYAVRWSAARSLGYSSILLNRCRPYLFERPQRALATFTGAAPEDVVDVTDAPLNAPDTTKVVCIGGGAGAEIVSLAIVARECHPATPFSITAVDVADWSTASTKLVAALRSPTALSAHMSESVIGRPEDLPLLNDKQNFVVDFMQQDALSWSLDAMTTILGNAKLCTIMFTLNELFTVSLPRTTAFLLNLTQSMPPGSHLLVVDSPGSYSEVCLKQDESKSADASGISKKYPMKWLLDHTLLTLAKENCDPAWEKVESEDSLWFRIDAKDRCQINYLVELENMRYQLHSYRRL